jgi:photosystem II stability/assembly factor-like uncharacterized protein
MNSSLRVFPLRTWPKAPAKKKAAFVHHRARLRLELLEDRTVLSAWTAVGPAPILNGNVPGNLPLSGRVTALAADPSDPQTIYVAAAGGGVWKTVDGGDSWTALTDDQPTLTMGAIALAPSDPQIIYAGTGEADGIGPNFLANYSPTTFYGRGVLKSEDAGATWTLLGNDVFDRRSIARIAVDPNDANTVYVAVGEPGFNGLNGNEGIWRSMDGGQTWVNTTAASGLPDDQPYTDVIMDPSDPEHLFTAIGNPTGNDADGLYETTDGGATWTASGGGTFPTGRADGRITLANSPSDPLRLYAAITRGSGINSGMLYRFLRSDNGGASWVTLTGIPNYLGQQGNYDTTLAVDPTNPDRVYAAGQGGPGAVIESMDAGVTWTGIAVGESGMDGPHNDHHAAGFDANGLYLDGNDAGIWRLDDPDVGAIHWTDLNTNLQLTTFIGIALDPADPTIAYGGSQDTGTEKYTGDPAWYQVRPNDGGYVRVDPANPQTVYHEYFGISLERSDDGGATWTTKTTGISGSGNFYLPYVLDPSNPTRLVLGTNRVFETTDGGDSWTPLSTVGMNGWTVNSPIDSVAVAPSDVNTIYASAGGHVFVTTDHGGSWTQIDVPGYTGHFFDIQVDPGDSQTAYAVSGVFGGGHVFQTTDAGQDWVDISGNLPDLPAHSLALGTGSLYLGTDAGVYFSQDGGTTWNHLGDGFPNAQVNELASNENLGILAACTHGRGAWELALGDLAPRVRRGSVAILTTLDSMKGQSADSTPLSANAGPEAESRGHGALLLPAVDGQLESVIDLAKATTPGAQRRASRSNVSTQTSAKAGFTTELRFDADSPSQAQQWPELLTQQGQADR